MAALLWPHQSEAVMAASPFTGPMAEDIGRRKFAISLHSHKAKLARRRRRAYTGPSALLSAFELRNGTMPLIDGSPLGSKITFLQLARELGFKAPLSVVIPGGVLTPDLIEAVLALDVALLRLCKPLRGQGGHGLCLAKTPEVALDLVARAGCDYIVQQFLPPIGGDLRYVLHRTEDDLRAGRPPSVRLAVERLGPVVVGDGVSTITQLIATLRPRWPVLLGDVHSTALEIIDNLRPRSLTDRRKLMMGVGEDRVLGRGKRLRLIASGNVNFPKHGRLPNAELLSRLDPQMLALLAGIEERTGRPFATFCVDMGLTADSEPVFYEFQVPFVSPLQFRLGIPNQAAAKRAFLRSMLRSGYLVRSMQQAA